MPAIQPALLRRQAALLAEQANEAKGFVRSLHHLLEYYADRARRPGQSGKPSPLLTAYHVRPPVLRQILQELEPIASQQPEIALELCDALWAEPYLEFRTLAISLLGKISPDPDEPLFERVQAWIQPSLERDLTQMVLNVGCVGLRREKTEDYLSMVERWLSHSLPFYQQAGLQALLPVVEDPLFDNLPVVFRLLSPMALASSPALRADIVEIFRLLARRSPNETAFFLRQGLKNPEQRDIPFLIRQCLSEFPTEQQESLRQAIRI
jgi:hypothetical protein